MTYDERDRRRAELRAQDPHGLQSGNQIDRIVAIESLEDDIDNLPDIGDATLDLKDILREMLKLV